MPNSSISKYVDHDELGSQNQVPHTNDSFWAPSGHLAVRANSCKSETQKGSNDYVMSKAMQKTKRM